MTTILIIAVATATQAISPLEEGAQLFEALDFERARGPLELALQGRDYTREQVVQLLSALGTTRAFLDDEQGARDAFRKLLAVDPGYALPYTTSPKATFLFQEERTASRLTRAPEIQLDADPFTQVGQPIELRISRPADPLGIMARLSIAYRRKSADEYATLELDAPAVGDGKVLTLPAIPAGDLPSEARGAILQVAVTGYDSAGWEVYRGPTQLRPREFAIGLHESPQWYERWWVWAIGGTVVVGGVATVLWMTRPESSDVSTRYIIR